MKHSYFLLILASLFLCAPIYGRVAGDGTSFAYDGEGNRVSRSIIIASPLASLDKGMSLDSTPEWHRLHFCRDTRL